jgi:hypothetical protein
MKDDFKKDLWKAIIGEYCIINALKRKDLTSYDIYNQSSLGVAMEYLDMTDGWTRNEFEYLKSRDGILSTYIDENGNVFNLTLKDILSL